MPKTPRENPRAERRSNAKKSEGDKVTRWIVIAMVGLVVVTLGALSLFLDDKEPDDALTVLNDFVTSSPIKTVVSDADDKAVVFNQGAPVKLSIWEDFQCPVCGQFEVAMGSYVEELITSGEAEVAYHFASFLGAPSRRAANAAYCAADEDRLLDFHKALFITQPEEGSAFWNPDNSEKFASCVQGDEKIDLVNAVAASMPKYGVEGTPTLFINGKEWKRTSAAFDVNEFRAAVEAATNG
ncbi:MAG: protein-disulfide isomerase [Actinobacteria bacterium]|nr:protein-disulfide isomerase [Actinomycetota bacterium]